MTDWMKYHVEHLGHDTSVRKHYKSENRTHCFNARPASAVGSPADL